MLPRKSHYIAALLALQVTVFTANATDKLGGVPEVVQQFYPSTMSIEPYLPSNLTEQTLGCADLHSGSSGNYLSAADVNYSQADWESRIQHQAEYFKAPASNGRITIIDFAKTDNQSLAYRYLSNANTHDELYEPWSSSKIFAYTGAVAMMRKLSADNAVGALSTVGNVSIGDLITSINSYAPTNNAPDDSNAIATYFANIAGRDFLTSLFHQSWLRMNNSDIRFRGAYGPVAFKPTSDIWQSPSANAPVNLYAEAADDPGYQAYRCDTCGLTGNKPMTTLAQAEWLKRLAVHTRETSTQHPYLQTEDVRILFYGDNGTGGMMAGISRMLPNALAQAIDPSSSQSPKEILDAATQGEWRIFQKIGWGPSETRMAGENVVLAHVCLPHFQNGREFTIAAQAAQPGYGDEFVNYAGMKIQDLLYQSFVELLYPID